MALIVEDGTGKSDAQSFASVDDGDAYFGVRPNAAVWTALSEEEKEARLINATDYIVLTYQGRWKGFRVTTTQALPFPRNGILAPDGLSYYPPSPLPRELIVGTLEAAISPQNSDFYSSVEPGKLIKRFKSVTGPIEEETEYAVPNSGDMITTVPQTKVDLLLRPLLIQEVASGHVIGIRI